MKVNTVDENKIVLHLNNQEITDIFGGYEFIDYDAADCRTKIHGLLAAAIPSETLPFDCERVLIEVKPEINGCAISLTKLEGIKVSSRTGIKYTTVSLVFENSEQLISSLKPLSALSYVSSELYTYENKYAVILTITRSRRGEITHLSEYCKLSLNRTFAMRIREYWKPICESQAVEKMADAFL